VLNDRDRVVGVIGAPPGDSAQRVATAVDYTLQGGEQLLAVTSTGAPRALTLPLAASVPLSLPLVVKDEGGGAATNNITVNRAGADTIDGATSKVINTNYGFVRLYSDGVSKWFSC
jgi:hypothetical protein